MDTQSQKNLQKPLLEEEAESISDILAVMPKSLNITDPDVIEVGDYLLPFSTGFEIECDKSDQFDIECFKSIPNIMDIDVDSGEQRFRIPSGIIGLNCLYDISLQLKLNSILNLGSGIHYHIDCTSFYNKITYKSILDNHKWLLQELDTWEYKGNYNTRGFSCWNICSEDRQYKEYIPLGAWIRFQSSFKTMEIRIGEMTFDYPLLFKRIIHANRLISKFKYEIIKETIKKENPIVLYEEDVTKTLKSRIKKI